MFCIRRWRFLVAKIVVFAAASRRIAMGTDDRVAPFTAPVRSPLAPPALERKSIEYNAQVVTDTSWTFLSRQTGIDPTGKADRDERISAHKLKQMSMITMQLHSPPMGVAYCHLAQKSKKCKRHQMPRSGKRNMTIHITHDTFPCTHYHGGK